MVSDNGLLFSVIIPSYNRADYILNTIRSVMNQTYTRFEIIVVDDGSTDNTDQVIASLAHDQLKYVRKENGERGAARNLGVKIAAGDYVTFLDSDDLLYPNHLSEAIRYSKENKYPEIFHLGYEVTDISGKIITPWKTLPDPVNKKLIEGNFLSCLGVFVKRDVMLNHPFNEDRSLSGSEDYELWLRLGAYYPIRTCAEVTASLVNHPNRSVLHIDVTKFLNRMNAIKKCLTSNEQVRAYYKTDIQIIFAYLDLYAALHLAMAKKKRKALRLLIFAVKQHPLIVLKYRFMVVIKKLILF